MSSVAQRLSDQDVEAVSAYYASLAATQTVSN
jgi:cytochrome c553